MPDHPISMFVAPIALGLLGAGCASTDRTETPARDSGGTTSSGSSSLFDLQLSSDEGKAKVWLPAPNADGEYARFLHVAGIETGLGANDVGLDRGKMGGARLVRFRRVGERVLLEELNTSFRAEAGDALEQRAAAQSFATSVLWGGEPVETRADGAALIDITDMLVRDASGIARTLKSTGQGSYSLDARRSALDVARCRAFPDNLEFAAVLTFTSKEPGSLARATAPDGSALTFVQRQGFVRLPDDDYERRPFDPRMGAFSIRYIDYGVALDAPLVQRFAVRHRVAIDPDSGAPEPIVYYVDRAAPEPVRSALVDGARWWAEAFAQAGYPGMFRVEVAPPDLDPLDVRYNVIQWVHRSTRGWSYGNAVSDPRTGEIIKGHVSLGSLRVRQDRLLFEGLLGVEKTGTGAPDDPVEIALARIRQLSAHEVGHTLGLAHNFAASVADRASVMDYPAPRVRTNGRGGLDVLDAYDVGVGAWDRHAIKMLYAPVPAGESVAAFHEREHQRSVDAGLSYLTDADARPAGAAQPYANLWDDGADPVSALEESLAVRRIALDRFGVENLAEGRPLAELEEVFVPLYLHHRYQVDAAVKAFGGVVYDHAMNRDGGVAMQPVALDDQRRALAALLVAMEADTLRIPASVRDRLYPRPPGYGGSRETFDRRAGAAFDWLGAAEVAARVPARGILNPQRLLRVELQANAAAEGDDATRFDANAVVGSLFGAMRGRVMDESVTDPETDALHELAYAVVVEEAMRSYTASSTARPVRHALRAGLAGFASDGKLGNASSLGDLQREVRQLLARPAEPESRGPAASSPDTPPGSPIGTADRSRWCSFR